MIDAFSTLPCDERLKNQFILYSHEKNDHNRDFFSISSMKNGPHHFHLSIFLFFLFIHFVFFYVQEAVNMKNISIPYEEKKSVCHEGKKLPQKEENAFKQAIVRRFTSVRPLMRQSSRSATRTRTTRRDCVCATRFWQLSPIVVVCWRNTVFMPSSLA